MTPDYTCDGGRVQLFLGDSRKILPHLSAIADVAIFDPPYGETALKWDKRVKGLAAILPVNSLWVFGSMRFFLEHSSDEFAGWTFSQDLVWEKHNGSNFHSDRFRRVHEAIVHYYRGEWASVYKKAVTTPDATKRTVREKTKPPHHLKAITKTKYVSQDGGPRMMRSVIQARSCHGFAIHPTQKPIDVLSPLIEYSSPPNGLVIDPTAGSGSTGVAARRLGRRFIGIELNPEIFAAMVDRFAGETSLFIQPPEPRDDQKELFT